LKKSPYVNYVRSFEAAARHLSFTTAAAELNYTQAGISGHVRALEEFIGRPLFVRNARSLTLTTFGTSYLPAVQKALRELDEATEGISTSLTEQLVTISCPISLAQNWLTERIAAFNTSHPEITVSIHGNIWATEEDKDADIRISYVQDEEIAEAAELLWQETLCVVCAPSYTVHGKRPSSPDDLRDANLIQILGRTGYWQQFKDAYGLTDWDLASRTQTNSLNVALELAANGLGCALVPSSLLNAFLKRNLLVVPFEHQLQSSLHCVMQRGPNSTSQAANQLAHWLKTNVPVSHPSVSDI